MSNKEPTDKEPTDKELTDYFENGAVEFTVLSREKGEKEWKAEFRVAAKDATGHETTVNLRLSHNKVQSLYFHAVKDALDAAKKAGDTEKSARLEANREQLKIALDQLIAKNTPG